MTSKRLEIEKVCDSADGIDSLLRWVKEFTLKGLGAGAVACRLGRPRRTLDQNRKIWPMCTDISKQVEWHGMKLSKDDWKDLLTGSLKGQTPIPGINGGVVFIGGGSSKLKIKEFCDLIEFAYSFGSEHDVIWSEKAKEDYEWAVHKNSKGRG